MSLGMQTMVIVVDDFYVDPDAVRKMALGMEYNSVGKLNYPGWEGEKALLPGGIAERFSTLIGRRVEFDEKRYLLGGFRLISQETGALTKVHADVSVDWAAMVYLTPSAPIGAGTGFFRHREYGVDRPPSDREAHALGFADANTFENEIVKRDMADLDKWELITKIAPVYNRLLLFRGSQLYHAPLGGFGERPENARLTQNFFFDEATEAPSAGRKIA
jgi:hypothetical protein